LKIIVPIKQVPETSAVNLDEKTGTMIREGVESIVNPLDLYAVECALQLREAHGGEVIALSMGPMRAEKALRETIAMGCDSAVLLSDKAFAGSDTWATGYALAAAIRKLTPFDLIICGERATDGDTGQVGPGIAAFLDLPVATYVGKLNHVINGAARLSRLVEGGYEQLEVQLPAVLTVVKEIAAPRLPTLRGKQRARKIHIPVWKPQNLNINPQKIGLDGSPTRVAKIFRPKISRKCEKLAASSDDAVAAAADRFVEFIAEKGLL
jgi:electron transfer flavoprotein beta subunit